MKLLQSLAGAEEFEAVPVVVQLDRLLLPGQDLIGFVLASQDEERLRPAHARVGAERPVIRSNCRLEREHRAPRLATGEQHTALLEGELALDARLGSFEDVLDLRAEPVGDDPQDADRRPRLAQRYLVDESDA